MKAGAEHVVPLSGAALALLPARGADDDLVFRGAGGARLGVHAMRRLAQELEPGVSFHGFRSSFRDWAGDETSFPREIAEAALAHTIGNAAERAYRRGPRSKSVARSWPPGRLSAPERRTWKLPRLEVAA